MQAKLPGGAMLVDDTYNSNPYSLKAALNALKDLKAKGGRVLVGLGEMMELGRETVSAHIEAGGLVAEMDAYFFTAMGDHAKEMIKGAVDKGFPPKRAVLVETHQEMAQALRDMMETGDLILLKGSRRAGLEKVVENLKGGC
jgi:UDP-N-acetylmuramoyl-tripeptide--D-alanyl-D-alanine ligase